MWYEEVMLPIRKLRLVGNCYVITIPKNIVKECELKNGSKIGVCLFLRKKKFVDEVDTDEKSVPMTKKQYIQYQQWLKEQGEPPIS